MASIERAAASCGVLGFEGRPATQACAVRSNSVSARAAPGELSSKPVACSHRHQHQREAIAGTHLHPNVANDRRHALTPVVCAMDRVDPREDVVAKISILAAQVLRFDDHASLYAL